MSFYCLFKQRNISKTLMSAFSSQLKVVDDEQRLLPINTEGELCVRGHGLFRGYWDDQHKTAETVDKNTFWYHTGYYFP